MCGGGAGDFLEAHIFFPGGWIQSQLWYLGTILTQSAALSHRVLDMKEMDLCWEVGIYSSKDKALWELALWTGVHCDPDLTLLQFGIVGFGSACNQVLVQRPRGQCTDVMPLSVRACAIRSSFQALHWPLKHWYMETWQDLGVKTRPSSDF